MPEVNKTDMVRPEKRDVFLFMAWTIKELSCDGQTKHGCVITNKRNRIIGTGYNSFPRDCRNYELPNMRPEKYPWMVHSERNAITNCVHNPIDYPDGATAYVTGLCCFDCTSHMWQNGVDVIYQLKRNSEMLIDSKDEDLKSQLCDHVPLTLHVVQPKFDFMKETWKDAKRLGFMHTEFEDSVVKFNGIE